MLDIAGNVRSSQDKTRTAYVEIPRRIKTDMGKGESFHTFSVDLIVPAAAGPQLAIKERATAGFMAVAYAVAEGRAGQSQQTKRPRSPQRWAESWVIREQPTVRGNNI